MREAVISASVLILGIWCVRKLFHRRIPAGVQYGLWFLVLVRLMMPLPEMVYQNVTNQDYTGIASDVSVMNVIKWAGEKWGADSGEQVNKEDTAEKGKEDEATGGHSCFGVEPGVDSNQSRESGGSGRWNQYIGREDAAESEVIIKNYSVPEPEEQREAVNPASGQGEKPGKYQKIKKAATAVWYTGILLMILWQVVVTVRFRRFLVRNRREISFKGERLYSAVGISSPFLIWEKAFHPVIYVPEHITDNEQMMEHAIAHEKMHWKHGDLWWSFFRSLLITIYWFHPLVWLAARISGTDCELYCDACVIRNMKEEARKEYGESLLELLENQQDFYPLSLHTGMGGSKREMEERICRIAQKKGMSGWQGIFLAMVMILLVGSTYTAASIHEESGSRGQKIVSQKQESDNALTMEKLISLFDGGKLQQLTYEDYMSYSNSQEEPEPEDDWVLNRYIYFYLYQEDDLYQKEPYKVGVSYTRKDKTIEAVEITNQETGEFRFLYTGDESRQQYTVDIHEFLHHEGLLDSYLSYDMPEGLSAGQCYYNVAGVSGGLGRLFYDEEDKKKGIYGQEHSVIWSAAGGVYYEENVVMDSDTKLPQCYWKEYQGNGNYAAKGEVVTLLQNGELQEVSGCENTTSIQGVRIGKNALQAQGGAKWYQMPKGRPDEKAPKHVKELLPLRLWMICVLPSETEDTQSPGCYMLFLNADRYSRHDAVKLAKSVHIFSDKERRDTDIDD